MKITVQYVEGLQRSSIPNPGETILDGVEIAIENIQTVSIYKRNKFECPFDGGNWICDVQFKDGELMCFKLPLHMEEQAILNYFSPILKSLNNGEINH